jgi:hypothetical protein
MKCQGMGFGWISKRHEGPHLCTLSQSGWVVSTLVSTEKKLGSGRFAAARAGVPQNRIPKIKGLGARAVENLVQQRHHASCCGRLCQRWRRVAPKKGACNHTWGSECWLPKHRAETSLYKRCQ